jgi:hypothetical protein
MKRIVMVAVALAALVGSGVCAFVIASPASATSAAKSAGVIGAQPNALRSSAEPAVSPGNVYTYYAMDGGPSEVSCEVLTFGTKTFSGDSGDQGTYKSTSTKETVTFENNAYFYAGVFTGTFESADMRVLNVTQYGGSFKLGKGTYDPGGYYGPAALVQGNDPWDVGHC